MFGQTFCDIQVDQLDLLLRDISRETPPPVASCYVQCAFLIELCHSHSLINQKLVVDLISPQRHSCHFKVVIQF